MKLFSWITQRANDLTWVSLKKNSTNSKTHDDKLKEKLLEVAKINQSLKDAVKGTKEQTAAIVDKLSNELEYTRRQMLFISENTVDGVLLVNDKGIILDANSSASIMFGQSRQDLIGSPISALLIHQTNSANFCATAYTVNGTEMSLEINVSHLQMKNSHTYLYVVKNISSEKEYCRQINELSAFQSSLLNTLPVPVYWKDETFRFIGCNRAFEDFMKVKESDIIGQNVFDILKSDLDRCVFLDMKDNELLEKPDGFIQVVETKLKNADNDTKNITLYNTPLLDSETKAFDGMIGIIVDSTDVQAFKNIYSMIFDLIPDPVAYYDNEFSFIECNTAFLEFIGFNRDSVIGKNVYDIIDGIENDNKRNLFISSLAIDGKFVTESKNENPSHVYEIENSVYKVIKTPMKDVDSNIIGMTTVISNVTAHKHQSDCNQCGVNGFLNKQDEPLFIIDDVGNFIFVNNTFCTVFGASEKDLLNKNMFDFVVGDGLSVDRIHESKWENVAVLKSKVTKIVNLKLVPVINSKKHGVFACGIITRF